jgi:hypothetical protein
MLYEDAFMNMLYRSSAHVLTRIAPLSIYAMHTVIIRKILAHLDVAASCGLAETVEHCNGTLRPHSMQCSSLTELLLGTLAAAIAVSKYIDSTEKSVVLFFKKLCTCTCANTHQQHIMQRAKGSTKVTCKRWPALT